MTAVPGNYDVIVTVTDLISKKDVSLSNKLFLPDPNNTEINITNITLSGKDNNSLNTSYFPLTTYDIPSKIDSLNFAFQIVLILPYNQLFEYIIPIQDL